MKLRYLLATEKALLSEGVALRRQTKMTSSKELAVDLNEALKD